MTELQTTRTLEVVAAEIRTFTASLLNNVIEIGRRLCEAKEMLPYGEFGAWVKENTAYSVSSANNFMRLFNEYGSAQGCLFGAETESQTFGKLSYSKALALLAVPAKEREEFVETHDVDAMSTRELAEAIRERDEAKQKLDAAVKEAKFAAAEEKKKLKDKLAETEKRRSELESELKDAKTAAANKEKELVEQQAGLISMEKARLEREVEDLKKKLAMSDAAVASFRVLFDQAQDILGRTIEAIGRVEDAETAGKLRAATRKLLEAYGEKVREGVDGDG